MISFNDVRVDDIFEYIGGGFYIVRHRENAKEKLSVAVKLNSNRPKDGYFSTGDIKAPWGKHVQQ